MKKLFILSAIAAGSLFFNKANAQISIRFGIHLPLPHIYAAVRPVAVEEAPVYNDNQNVPANYTNDDDYYYLPEVEAYYSVAGGCYYYNDGSNWISAAYLPGAYHDYDWRRAVRYEVHAPRPYLHHEFYVSRWGGYAGDRSNWGHRFDNRPYGGYAYSRGNFDNRSWSGNRNDNRGGWAGRPNQNYGNNNHNNWSGGLPDNNDNHGNRGGGQPNNGGHGDNHGSWGNQPNNGGHNNQNNGAQRFADGGDGHGMRVSGEQHRNRF